jgi:subtilisin family serine protease
MAAVPFNDSNTPQDFSSHGPSARYFGPVSGTTPAAPAPAPQIVPKPDVTATDGGRTTFFSFPPVEPGVYRFFGTSAASPHAAGVGALLKERAKQRGVPFDQRAARQALQETAATVASGGPNITGAGLINAERAMASVEAIPKPTILLPMIMKDAAGPTPPPPSAPDLVASVSVNPDKRTFAAGEAVEVRVTGHQSRNGAGKRVLGRSVHQSTHCPERSKHDLEQRMFAHAVL